MYHSVDELGSPVSVSPTILARHLDSLEIAGYMVLPLGEAMTALREPGPRGRRIAALTFDDGYASVHSIVLPMLAARGWRATVFPVTDYIGRDNRWPSQASFVPTARLLGWEQLHELASAGWEIGAHTRTHPDLTNLLVSELDAEVAGGKASLEDRLGRVVELFAYPCGLYNARVRASVRRYYQTACTTDMGWVTQASPTDALERLEMWYFAQRGLHRLFLSHLMRPYVILCRAVRDSRRQHPADSRVAA